MVDFLVDVKIMLTISNERSQKLKKVRWRYELWNISFTQIFLEHPVLLVEIVVDPTRRRRSIECTGKCNFACRQLDIDAKNTVWRWSQRPCNIIENITVKHQEAALKLLCYYCQLHGKFAMHCYWTKFDLFSFPL